MQKKRFKLPKLSPKEKDVPLRNLSLIHSIDGKIRSSREDAFFDDSLQQRLGFKPKNAHKSFLVQSSHNKFTRLKEGDWGQASTQLAGTPNA